MTGKTIRNPQTGEIIPSTSGRPRVGVACFQGIECSYTRQCQGVYTQELLRDDGSCSEYHPKKIPQD